MNKVLNFTNKIVGVTNPFSSGTNVSVGSWGRIMGIDDLSFGSLEDTKRSISDIKAALSQTITTAACLKYMVYDNPTEMLNFLDQLVTGAVGAVGSVIDEIYDAIYYQISTAVNQVVGSILAVIDALSDLIGSIMTLCSVITDTVQSWLNWGNLKIELELQQENCKDMFSSIAACLLNKFLGSYLEEFTEKIVGKINDVGNDINDKLYEELQDADTFSSFATQEAFLLKKAAIQIKGLSKENIIG